MNQSQPHRATPDQWHNLLQYRKLDRRIPDHVSVTLELAARIVALEAAQHAHADVSRLSDAEREQMAQELAKPAAWRPLEVETTPGTEPASDEPINMATAQQILNPRKMVEGTFEHGGETYRFEAKPERESTTTRLHSYKVGKAEPIEDWGKGHTPVNPPDATMDELRAASAEARPGGLVERVADAIVEKATSAGIVDDRPARAAIREVAAWLRTGRLLHAAELLELEADRG